MSGKPSIGIVHDVRYYDHYIQTASKECPERLRTLYQDLEQAPEFDALIRYIPRPATDEEILQVHSELYLQQVHEHALNPNPFSYDTDTYLIEDSPYVGKLAAGGCITLADAAMNGEIDCGFALIRPPGHHAETGRGMGFCVFNNVAVTAQHLIDHYGIERILIVDFDAHHGNGTQEIFYASNQVLTFSIHQKSIFPFSGKGSETGVGDGIGYNVNIPVPSQFGDAEYSCIFGTVLQNIVEHYLPQFILVSAGFDAHEHDSISQTNITTEGYYAMTRALRYFAEEIAHARLLYVLEGGYHIASLSESVRASLRAMMDQQDYCSGFRHAPRALQAIKNTWPSELLLKWGSLF